MLISTFLTLMFAGNTPLTHAKDRCAVTVYLYKSIFDGCLVSKDGKYSKFSKSERTQLECEASCPGPEKRKGCTAKEIMDKSGYAGCYTSEYGVYRNSPSKEIDRKSCLRFCDDSFVTYQVIEDREIIERNTEKIEPTKISRDRVQLANTRKGCSAKKIHDNIGSYLSCLTEEKEVRRQFNKKELTELGCETFCDIRNEIVHDQITNNKGPNSQGTRGSDNGN